MTRHLATFFFQIQVKIIECWNPQPGCWNSYMWTSTNISSPASSVLSPHLLDSLTWGNSTFLRPFDPPLSARYREQSLLCFASRLSHFQMQWLNRIFWEVPRTRWCCQSLLKGESLKLKHLLLTQRDWLDGVKRTHANESSRLLLSDIQKCYSYTCRLPALSWIASR